VTKLSLCFDRAGRSSGTAFVTYATLSDARTAIREFDGANANGQPIRLTLLPTGPKFSSVDGIRGRGVARNPFDTAIVPGRSLFERIEDPGNRARGNVTRGGVGRSRSRSPGAPRRTNTSKPAPEGVDRYVPPRDGRGSGRRRSRSRSIGRRGRAREDRRGRAWEEGREKAANGRVRKTQEELDREMEDYWSASGTAEANGTQTAMNGETTGNLNGAPAAAIDDGDIDMIE
jgi:THO complex subunit 4